MLINVVITIIGLIILYVMHCKILGNENEGLIGCVGTVIGVLALYVIAANWSGYISGGLLFIAFIIWSFTFFAHVSDKNQIEAKRLEQEAWNKLTPEEKRKREAEKQLKLEEKRKQEAEEQLKREEEKRQKTEEYLEREKLRKFERQIAARILVLDSNIWMDIKQTSDALFEALVIICKKEKRSILMYADQYDEICNKKKRELKRSGDVRAACRAINRIDNLQGRGLVTIEGLEPNARPHAYADPVIVTRLAEQAKNGVTCTLVTNDVELRTRAREHLKDSGDSNWYVIGLEEFQKGCDAYVAALKTE